MKNQRAFTLVELLIVCTIISVVLGGILVAVLNGQGVYLSSDASIQAQEELRRAFDIMVREIREAGEAVVSESNQTLDFKQALGYNLDLEGCTADTVCWGAVASDATLKPGWQVRYRIDKKVSGASELLREVLDGTEVKSSRTLAQVNGATATSFFDVKNDTVTINLQVQIRNKLLPTGSYSSPTLATKVKLRNPSGS